MSNIDPSKKDMLVKLLKWFKTTTDTAGVRKATGVPWSVAFEVRWILQFGEYKIEDGVDKLVEVLTKHAIDNNDHDLQSWLGI